MEIIARLKNAQDYPEKMKTTEEVFKKSLENVIKKRLELREGKDTVKVEFIE